MNESTYGARIGLALEVSMAQQLWQQWQQQVLNKIRRDYHEVLATITLDDVDWSEWRSLFEQGRSPSDAVDYAFVRVTDKKS